MKFTKSVRRWSIAAAIALVLGYLAGFSTILFNVTTVTGQTMSPDSAMGWCKAIQSTLGTKPPVCSQISGPANFGYAVLFAGVVLAVVAVVKAVRAAKVQPL